MLVPPLEWQHLPSFVVAWLELFRTPERHRGFVYEFASSAWRFEDQTVQRMLEAVQKIQKEFDVSIATMQDLSEKVPVAHAGRVGGATHCHAR